MPSSEYGIHWDTLTKILAHSEIKCLREIALAEVGCRSPIAIRIDDGRQPADVPGGFRDRRATGPGDFFRPGVGIRRLTLIALGAFLLKFFADPRDLAEQIDTLAVTDPQTGIACEAGTAAAR